MTSLSSSSFAGLPALLLLSGMCLATHVALGQGFADVTQISGILSGWATSTSFPSRGCAVGYNVAGPGSSSSHSPLPCDTSRDARFDLSGYQPVMDLLQPSLNRSFTYVILADATLAQRPLLLVTFSSFNGSAVNAFALNTSYDPLSLQVESHGQAVYIVARQIRLPSSLFVLTVDPSQTSWSSALISATPVIPNNALVPLGAVLISRSGSAYLPISGQLVIVVGSALPFANSTYLSSSTAVWHLLVVTPGTGSWTEVVPTDPSLLSSDSFTLTTLGLNDLVLISSSSAAWLFNVSASSFTVLRSFAQHLQRADVALGCGQVNVAEDVLPVTIPSNNSSVPFVAIPLYAEPTLLSAVKSPFWYLLYVDAVRDLVTYGAIDTPPLFFNQIVPAPSVTSLTAGGGPLAYNSTSGAALVWTGSGFVPTSTYTCVCPQATSASSSVTATWFNSTSLTCSLPAGWANVSSNTWVSVQLVADDAFVLYASQLRVVQAHTGQQSVNASTVPRSAIGRMMVSYSVSSSLTPSPVVSSSSSGYSYATVGSATPLQLHSQLTRGLTFVTQQLQNLTTQPTSASQVLPAIQAALTHPASSTIIGLNDAYALFASASETASIDFTNMASSVVGLLAQDTDSLPQLLSGLNAGSASTLALDLVGAQAQDWLSNNLDLDTADPTDLDAVLGLGITLPEPSSTMLSQLTSLGMNSALQLASSIPVLSDVLDNPTVSTLLGLPDELSSLVDDPVDTIADLLPGGALKDTVLSFLGVGGDDDDDEGDDGDDDVSFAGTLSDAVDNLFDNVGDSASDVVDTVESLGSSFLDDIANDAVDAESGSFAGPIGSLAGMLSGALGADTQVQKVVTTAVSVVGGVAEIFCGDVSGGIGDIISGFAGLFGGGSKGPDETQQLAQQMTSDFNQVLGALSNLSNQINSGFNAVLSDLGTVQTNLLNADQQLSTQLQNGFGELSNLTLAVYSNLQQQQLAIYQNEISSLSSITVGVGSVELSLAAAEQQLNTILSQLNAVINEVQFTSRQTIYRALEGWMGTVTDLLQNGELGSSQPREVSSSALSSYQTTMNSICESATTQANVYAADQTMSGNPTISTTNTYSAAINGQPNYDLNFALLPSIVSSYLGQSLPSILQGAGSLANPLAWAYAANFWLEARQVALQSPSISSFTTCLSNLWQTGQQLQIAVRVSVAQPTLQALVNRMSAITAAAQASFQGAVLAQYPTSVPSSVNVASLITAINIPGSSFAAFDDACAVVSLLLTLGQATGLGSNGFTNGFVSSGTAATGWSGAPPSFIPGSVSTQLIQFAPVTSTASFSQVLTNSLNVSLAGSQSASAAEISQQQQMIFQQASVLFNWTMGALQNAVAAFYPPCYVVAVTAPRSLPIIDTTLRRLAGFMMQTQTPFTLQGQRVLLPPPLALPPVVPVSSSSSSVPALHPSSSLSSLYAVSTASSTVPLSSAISSSSLLSAQRLSSSTSAFTVGTLGGSTMSTSGTGPTLSSSTSTIALSPSFSPSSSSSSFSALSISSTASAPLSSSSSSSAPQRVLSSASALTVETVGSSSKSSSGTAGSTPSSSISTATATSSSQTSSSSPFASSSTPSSASTSGSPTSGVAVIPPISSASSLSDKLIIGPAVAVIGCTLVLLGVI